MSSSTKSSDNSKESLPSVAVIGAGLIGTLTTYWLSTSKRYNVICIDKGPAPASGTSKANAGRFCPSLLGDFAPKISTLKSLLKKGDDGGIGKVEWSPSVVFWGIKYVQAATLRRSEINSTLNDLGTMSTRLMDHLLKNVIKLDIVAPNLWVYGESVSLSNGKQALESTKGARFTELDIEKCSEVTSISKKILGTTGGCLSVESDYTADARDFTEKIANACPKQFARFAYNTRVETVSKTSSGNASGDKYQLDLSDGSKLTCDYVVVACGPWSSHCMSKWFGVDVPILPVRGASVQLEQVKNPPLVGFSDNSSGDVHFQVTPYGKDSLRLVGFADVVASLKKDESSIECPQSYRDALISRAKVVLPNTTWGSETPMWCGVRPISPDRLPIIGESGVPGVYLNVGHGAIGWTLAAVSGYLLANEMLRKHGHEALGVDAEADGLQVGKKLGLQRFSLFH